LDSIDRRGARREAEFSVPEDRLKTLEALGIALLTVIRDDRYDNDLRCVLRGAYDSVEERVCALEAELRAGANARNPTEPAF